MASSINPATDTFYAPRPRKFPWINLVLFLATCVTTLLVGALLMEMYDPRGTGFSQVLGNPSVLLRGLPFSMAVMAILLSHEMGHYLTCVYYRIDASLPYFIPFPNPVGTMGAFIRIRSPFPNRRSLLEVGVAGPIAGFVVSVIVLVLSLVWSDARFVPAETAGIRIIFSDPLIFTMITSLIGMPSVPEGFILNTHPVSLAAWFGFFVTALNMVPAAQLDGGHIIYALFRDLHWWISRTVGVVLLPLGIFYWPGWLVWFAFLLLMRFWHPPTLNDTIPLQRRQVILGWIGIVLLILCFTPNPIFVE